MWKGKQSLRRAPHPMYCCPWEKQLPSYSAGILEDPRTRMILGSLLALGPGMARVRGHQAMIETDLMDM